MSQAERSDTIGLDDSSFEEFVAGSSSHLFALARLLTGGHQAEAEDLLQCAFERAYRHWRRISGSGDPEPYVRQILVNASVDMWRRLRRRPEEPMRFPGGDPAVADRAAEVADRDLLLRGLARLPVRQRAVLVLRYFEDLPRRRRPRCWAAASALSRARQRAPWPGYARSPARPMNARQHPGRETVRHE
jgi:RNA polymerase sigma factor (sigma-70 family)